MNNPFATSDAHIHKLLTQYAKHGSIIVGVDFDFTLYDSTKPYRDLAFYDDILQLVLAAQASPACKICLWTASQDLFDILVATALVGIEWDYFNESPILDRPGVKKAHFNILLDDTAGLKEAVTTLRLFLAIIENDKLKDTNENN